MRTWIGAKDRNLLWVQIQRLSHSGVPLPEVFAIAGGVLGGRSGRELAEIGAALGQGAALVPLLAQHRGLFDDVDIALLDAALHAGSLPDVAAKLAARHLQTAEVAHQLLSSLWYPAFLLSTSVLLAPVQTLLTQGAWAWLAETALGLGAMIGVGVLAWLALRAWTRSPRRWDMLAIFDAIPGARFILRARRFALIFDVLALALESGLPLPSALVLAGAATGEQKLRTEAEAGQRMLRDHPLSEVVSAWPGAPLRTRERLVSAERSGHMPQVATELAGEAHQRLKVGLQRGTWLLRGLVTAIVIAMIVGSLITQVKALTSDPLSALQGEEGEALRKELQRATPQKIPTLKELEQR